MDTMERGHREKSSTYVPGVCKTVQRRSHVEQLSKTNYLFIYIKITIQFVTRILSKYIYLQIGKIYKFCCF